MKKKDTKNIHTVHCRQVVIRRIIISIVMAALFSGIALTFMVSSARAVIVDRIVAIVNSHVITLSELEKKARPYLQQYIEDSMSPEEKAQMKQTIYAKILPQMIDDYLVQEEIKKLGITVSDAEVENAIDNICANNGITRHELKQKLEQEGTSFEKYKKQLATQIERARLIGSKVQSKVVITDEQVRAYLSSESGNTDYGGPYYVLDHVCVVPEADTSSAKAVARKRAEEALKALKDGENFETVAHRYSSKVPLASDVRLGVFSLDEMSPSLRKAVEELKPGEVSDVIETPLGFQILKLVSISNSKQVDIDPAVMEETRQKLYNQEVNQRFQDWLNELRSKSTIRILL